MRVETRRRTREARSKAERRFLRSGFTLVELMIVVAIVGTLSTIVIPTFRSMIMKARTTEAKLALGAVYRVEVMFAAEFGIYGNNLLEMGLDTEGASETSLYRSGFMSYGSGQKACGTSKLLPDLNSLGGLSGIAGTIMALNPRYYQSSKPEVLLTTIGRLTLDVCPTPGNPAGITTPIDIYSSPGRQYDRFTAAAAGVIAPGINRDNPEGGAADLDVWVIDESGTLRNVQSGIH